MSGQAAYLARGKLALCIRRTAIANCSESLRRRRLRLWPNRLDRIRFRRRSPLLLLSAGLLVYLLGLSVRIIAQNIVISCGVDERSQLMGRSLESAYSENESMSNSVCHPKPSTFMGKITVDPGLQGNLTMAQVETIHSDVSEGGEWRPLHCTPRHRVAIIVPYRDRLSQLPVLLHYLLPVLKRQLLHFRIFVVEQHGQLTFNKGRVMNAGFKEALQVFSGFRCVVFHDVDLLPEDDRIEYSCLDMPRHLSVSVNEMNYKLPYSWLVGGVLSMPTEHFLTVNGYSNLFWGWGGEDDDMAFRIVHSGLSISRPAEDVGRFYMLQHPKRSVNASLLTLWLIQTTFARRCNDGLRNVRYKVNAFNHLPLFTCIKVDVGEKEDIAVPWWGALWVWLIS